MGLFVDERDGIGVEDLAIAAGAAETMCDVLGGVADSGFADREACVDPGPQRAVLGECEALTGLRQSDQDDGEQGEARDSAVVDDPKLLKSLECMCLRERLSFDTFQNEKYIKSR